MNQSILRTTNLAIGYQSRRKPPNVIADGLNLHLHTGQLVCLLGPNGAGKSTLIRTLAGMQLALSGQVLLAGNDITTLRPQTLAQKLSVVLTDRISVGLLSAYALVALGRYPYTEWHGGLTAADEAIVQQALQDVGAAELATRSVGELSDGERQKVMIARALAQEPQLMILDEPTAFLDLPRRVEIMQILRRLAHDNQRTILLSTHDLDLALRNADVIWLLANGRIHIGAPEDLVLDGTFAEAFAVEGVAFDTLSGAFRIQQGYKGEIDVIGDEINTIWTVRALERAGFRAHAGPNGSPLRVTHNDSGWHLQHVAGKNPESIPTNGVAAHASLADLTAALKQQNEV